MALPGPGKSAFAIALPNFPFVKRPASGVKTSTAQAKCGHKADQLRIRLSRHTIVRSSAAAAEEFRATRQDALPEVAAVDGSAFGVAVGAGDIRTSLTSSSSSTVVSGAFAIFHAFWSPNLLEHLGHLAFANPLPAPPPSFFLALASSVIAALHVAHT